MTKRPRRGYDPQARASPSVRRRRHHRPRRARRRRAGSNPTESETSLVRSSALVAVGTMLSRVTGFARIAAIAYALGASTLAGTYSYANEAPNIVYELLLGGVLTATLVPLFVKYHETDDDDAPSAIFTVAIVALAAITVIGIVAAPWIVELYTLNVQGCERRRATASSRPTSCGCSCRRCSSTASSRSPPRCSTRGDGSSPPRSRRCSTTSSSSRCSSRSPASPTVRSPSTTCSTTRASCCSSGWARPPVSW